MYLVAMEYELRHFASYGTLPVNLASVYLGGGSPAVFDTTRLVLLVKSVRKYFTLLPDCEITIELNPLDCTDEVLRALKKAGFNRYSLGVQSFQDGVLEQLGRAHDAGQARAAIRLLQEETDNLSIDLIMGLPGDSLQRWQADLQEALTLDPGHLSMYSLQVEEETPLARQISQRLLPAVNEELQADLWEWTCDRLYPTDYSHYEISNWAKPGKESRHNLSYWQYKPYFGVGAGASGFLQGRRYTNIANPREYTAVLRKGHYRSRFPAAEMTEELTTQQKVTEQIILALRTDRGLNIDLIEGLSGAEFWRRYGQKINHYQQMGLLWRNGQTIGLTEPGMSLSNRIFLTFMP